MQKEPFSQLELFSQDSPAPAAARAARPLSAYLIAYEKAVALVIAFLLTGVVAFCFGVEKGKSITSAKNSVSFDMARTQPARAVAPAAVAVKPKPAVPVSRNPVSSVPLSQTATGELLTARALFTIQVASYQTRALAQREMDRLLKQGFKAAMITRGSFQVVCVGNFSNKESAKSLLSQLKNKYRDCYIRRL